MTKFLKIFFYSNALLLILGPLAFCLANPIRSYSEIENIELKLAIGKKIYNQPGDGCWSCHGAEGVKADGVNQDIKDKHKNISDLRNPATWTSFNIIKKYSGESEMLSQRDISLSLVRLGAEDWNKDLAPLIREYTGSNIIFFDEQMIGIHSKLLKKNARSVSRNLKREKVKFKAKDVIDIMATSVFFYIEEVFIKKRKDTN